MSETVKLIIEIPKATYEDLKQGKIYSSLCEAPQGLVEGIQNGTPLESNSDRAEVQAYFDGEAYGWEEGRKALIEDIKAEIKTFTITEKSEHDTRFNDAVLKCFNMLDNIGKEESEDKA